ncbi:copper resistance protein CopC [Nocardiopsis sp. CNT-189]|uniref:copper resistance CopC family protein n=1 Tax=Nocardiopsis oceanisediminis TaxID=2816862 RepID=UPI003B35E127
MSTAVPTGRNRRRAAAVAAASALAWAALGSAPAQAHDRLIDAAPGDGEALESPPEEVALVFSGELLDVGAAVTVVDAEGEAVASGEPEVDGAEVVQAVDGLPDGGYAVRWRVVSGDGHPVSGGFGFTVGDPDAPVPDPAQGAPQASPSPAAAPDREPAGPASDPAGRWVLLGLAGAALGAAGYAAVAIASARRSAP